MSLTLTEHPEDRWIEITVAGRVTEADLRGILDRLEALIDGHGKLRIVEVIESFDGYEFGSLWPGLVFDYRHLRDFTHAAVVSDIGWLGPVSRAVGALMPITVRTFTLAELDDARAWVADPDAATA